MPDGDKKKTKPKKKRRPYVPTGRPRGRPTVVTPEVKAEVIRRVAAGESLRAICRDDHMPSRSNIQDALPKDSNFQAQYTEAQENRFWGIADELMEIADDESQDIITRPSEYGPNPTPNMVAVQRARTRIDTRKWLLSKMLPKTFSDKYADINIAKVEMPQVVIQQPAQAPQLEDEVEDLLLEH